MPEILDSFISDLSRCLLGCLPPSSLACGWRGSSDPCRTEPSASQLSEASEDFDYHIIHMGQTGKRDGKTRKQKINPSTMDVKC